MELFTEKRTFYLYNGMAEPQFSEVEVTITNDTWDDPDGEFVTTRWFSDHRCKIMEETTDEIPTDEQVAEWICRSERVEEVSTTPWEFEDDEDE